MAHTKADRTAARPMPAKNPGHPERPRSGSSGNPATGLSILDRIVARKRVEVAKAKANTALQTLKTRCAQLEPARNFFASVVSDRGPRGTRVIAEIKRKSPSAGVVRDDFDPVRIATQYAEAGAAALSVLTDEEFFGGHLGYIQQIREAVPLPVLRKDFIVDEYQIWESRAANADAVLLIAEILPEGELLDMMILARELGMTTLVEAHDVEKLLKIKRHIGFPHAGYSLLGINNRDLRTMEVDLGHTIRMAEMVEDKRVLVSESGIRSAADLRKLRQHGVYIVLVGESLLRQPDPGAALRALLGK
jgi:indole-3-glycerol phosphate synthase